MKKTAKIQVISFKKAVEETLIGFNKKKKVLKTRWGKINKLLKGLPERYYLAISGTSGSGKSYFLNKMMEDFQNKELNKYPVVHVHFNLEMDEDAEVLRMVEDSIGIPFHRLSRITGKLTNEEFKKIKERLEKIKDYNIHFINNATPELIVKIAKYFRLKYPYHFLVISLDHYLLAEDKNSKSEVELVSNVSKAFVYCKKNFNALCIMIGQLNDKIEDRTDNPNNHFPRKGDLFSSKASFRDPDCVCVIHRPETLGIARYGKDKIPAKNMIAFHLLKGRFIGKAKWDDLYVKENKFIETNE